MRHLAYFGMFALFGIGVVLLVQPWYQSRTQSSGARITEGPTPQFRFAAWDTTTQIETKYVLHADGTVTDGANRPLPPHPVFADVPPVPFKDVPPNERLFIGRKPVGLLVLTDASNDTTIGAYALFGEQGDAIPAAYAPVGMLYADATGTYWRNAGDKTRRVHATLYGS